MVAIALKARRRKARTAETAGGRRRFMAQLGARIVAYALVVIVVVYFLSQF